MSPLNRRLFLGAVASLPATAATAAASALLTTPPPEDARLIELGDSIEPALLAYRHCTQCRADARALAESLIPPVPPEMISPGFHHRFWFNHQLDVEQKILHDEPLIVRVQPLCEAIRSDAFGGPRTKIGKRARAVLKIAREYEAQHEAAIEHSGIRQASRNASFAATDLHDLAYAVQKIEPLTMLGVVIQARALLAYAEAEQEGHYHVGRAASVLGRELAGGLLRLTDGLRYKSGHLFSTRPSANQPAGTGGLAYG